MKRLLFLQKIIVLLTTLIFSFSLSVQSVFAKQEPSLENEIKHDQRPTDLEYAIMSECAYFDAPDEDRFGKKLPGWKVYRVVNGNPDYIKGVVFENTETKQLVVAYRGTRSFLNVFELWESIKSIVINTHSPQREEAFDLTQEIMEYAKAEGFHLSFTGHCLGAFLAELSVFFCHKYGLCDNYSEVNAVTFESPGSEDALEKLQTHLRGNRIELDDLDIVTYVSNPNFFNTLNHRIGSVYHIEPSLDYSEWWNPLDYTYAMRSHSMRNIAKHFKKNYPDNGKFLSCYMTDWPLAKWKEFIRQVGGIVGSIAKFNLKSLIDLSYNVDFIGIIDPESQQKTYFKYAGWNKEGRNYQISLEDLDSGELYELTFAGHFLPYKKYNSRLTLPLKHFSKNMQDFLEDFHKLFRGVGVTESDQRKLIERWNRSEIPAEIIQCLMCFKLEAMENGKYIVTLDVEAAEIFPPLHIPATTIHEFRLYLSKHLNENPDKIKVILGKEGGGFDFPKLSHIPELSPYFTERKAGYVLSEKIKTLEESENRKGVKVFFITGIPGSGKTELAKEYALNLNNEGRYSFVRMFNAEAQKSLADKQKPLQDDFESLARSMDLDVSELRDLKGIERRKRTMEIVLNKLKSEKVGKPWLWIFDNADEYETVKDYIPDDLYVQGTIIVTARSVEGDIKGERGIAINEGMLQVEAEDLFYSILKKGKDKNIFGTKEEALDLIEILDRLPLAVSVAALCINREGYTFSEYKKLLLEEKTKLESEEKDAIKHNFDFKYTAPQAAAIRLLIEDLDEVSKKILELCSFINPNHIPRYLLIDYINYLVDSPDLSISEQCLDIMRIKNLINYHPLLAQEHSDSTLGGSMFFVHRETRAQMRKLLFKQEEYKSELEFYKAWIDRMIRFIIPKFSGYFDDFEQWKKEKQLVSHVEAIYSLAMENSIVNEEIMELLDRLAKHYIIRGEYKYIIKVLTEFVRKIDDDCLEDKKNFLKKTEQYISILSKITEAYNEIRDKEEAEKFAKLSYDLAKKHLGEEHIKTLRLYLLLDRVNMSLGKERSYDDMVNFQNILETREIIHENEYEEIKFKDSLGKYYYPENAYTNPCLQEKNLIDWEKAKKYLTEALSACSKLYKDGHPFLAVLYNHLGHMHHFVEGHRDIEFARHCYRQILDICENDKFDDIQPHSKDKIGALIGISIYHFEDGSPKDAYDSIVNAINVAEKYYSSNSDYLRGLKVMKETLYCKYLECKHKGRCEGEELPIDLLHKGILCFTDCFSSGVEESWIWSYISKYFSGDEEGSFNIEKLISTIENFDSFEESWCGKFLFKSLPVISYGVGLYCWEDFSMVNDVYSRYKNCKNLRVIENENLLDDEAYYHIE